VDNRFHTPEKNRVRNNLLSLGNRVFKTAILMPGQDLQDIKLLLERGHFTQDTAVIAVERNPDTAAVLREQLPRYFKRSQVMQNNLSSLSGFVNVKFDFVYLDTCGELTQDLYFIIQETAANCHPNAFFACTFAASSRRPLWSELSYKKLFGNALGEEPRINKEQYYRIVELDKGTRSSIQDL